MDRSTGTPLGFALVLLFAIAFGWVLLGAPDHQHPATATANAGANAADATDPKLATYATPAQLQAAQAQPALTWPDQMPEPMTNYVGRRVSAFGLRVTGVDANEGFWVQKGDRRAWVQLETSTESPYTVRVGDTVSLTGRVLPHNPDFPSQIMFCPDRTASREELAKTPWHLAVRVDALSFGTG